jgi:uncharacterized protein (UPF0335 family)
LAEIKQLLLALTEKVERIEENLTEKIERLEEKVSDMDNRMSAGLNDSNEVKFVKVIINTFLNVSN